MLNLHLNTHTPIAPNPLSTAYLAANCVAGAVRDWCKKWKR